MALIWSDSILARIKGHHVSYLKEALSVNSLDVQAFPGQTAQFLLSQNQEENIFSIIARHRYRYVIISAGQNDISRAVASGSVEEISSQIFLNISQLTSNLAREFPQTTFFLLPLTLRTVCTKPHTKFPDSKRNSYIEKVNQVIKGLSRKFSSKANESKNLCFIDGSDLWDDPHSLVIEDGIHLSSNGLDEYLINAVIDVKTHINDPQKRLD